MFTRVPLERIRDNPFQTRSDYGDEVADIDWLSELDEAERRAWASLARYKFQMFGYWAAIWVHLNRITGAKRANPWRALVRLARTQVPSS